MMRALLEGLFLAMFAVGVALYTYGVYARAVVTRRRTDRSGAPYNGPARTRGEVNHGCS